MGDGGLSWTFEHVLRCPIKISVLFKLTCVWNLFHNGTLIQWKEIGILRPDLFVQRLPGALQ